jgi:hypothetical protein
MYSIEDITIMEEKDKIIELMDAELDIVHNCLTDLYDPRYNNEKDRINRIKEALNEIEKIYEKC